MKRIRISWSFSRGQGEAKGREEGLEKGKIEVAKAMKNDGLAPEVISRYSGLSIEQIKSL